MKLFFKKIAVFFIGIISIIILYHLIFDYLYNKKEKDNSIFIWGDSQAYQGIDLERLREKTGLNVYSAAKHGAGVYDFLVFANMVPENSTVLVAISKPCILRRKDSDYNMSGLSISSLYNLYLNNYSILEITKIAKNNISSLNELFVEKSYLYPLKNQIIITEKLESIKKVYKVKPGYVKDKINLYLKGLQVLENKGCKIKLIYFPYEKALKEVEKSSEINELNTIHNIIIHKFKNLNIEIVNLNLTKDKRVFYDFTHLNQYGAIQVSEFLAIRVLKDENHFYLIE
jgi:hypothetical protein